MKKITSTILIAGTLLTSHVMAEDVVATPKKDSGLYYNGGIGIGYAGLGFVGAVGASVLEVKDLGKFGWEGEAYYMFGSTTDYGTFSSTYYGYGANAFATFSYKVPGRENIEVMAGLGIGYNNIGYSYDWSDGTTTDYNFASMINYKVQAKYDFTKNMKLIVGYSAFLNYSVGVQIKL